MPAPPGGTTAPCSSCAADVGARLGQHFLFDPAILGRIADAALPARVPLVLEIGPGKGPLTRELARRADRVVAIEADRRLAEALTRTPPAPNVTVVAGDALQALWPPATVICGNIPYQITSPLIARALTPPRPLRIVFLVQREVADRLAAPPGHRSYGALSAAVQLVADVERLFTVRAGAFRPPPRSPGDLPPAADEERTRRLIQALFQRRRQQLQRSLREAAGLDAASVAFLLAASGIPPATRPEELPPGAFLALARAIPTI
jgi:16S rRNA (adenine1518-N6/adenine1519-N6)-dimethyltransferase